ncbi:MAG: 30S ribosomal protein S17 [Candidatus Marinimicrobia bacterium]|nr:30S ribosomal protein S17 [Candidatus Neomarinimicrobiota bacterium]
MSYTNRKEKIGIVVSNKMDKTVTVLVSRRIKHSVYGKYINRGRKFMAHDEANACRIGDTISIVETRPISRNKRWRVKDILDHAPEAK